MKNPSISTRDFEEESLKILLKNINTRKILPLLNLPEHDVEILRMTFCEWKSVEEIAEFLNLSNACVRYRRVAAIGRLSSAIILATNAFLNSDELFHKMAGDIRLLQAQNKQLLRLKKISETAALASDFKPIRELLKIELIRFDLSIRTLNCLKAADAETLGDLVSYTKNELLKFRNFGKKSLTELEDLVEAKGLTFGMDISQYKLDNEPINKSETEEFDETTLYTRQLLKTKLIDFDLSVRAMNVLTPVGIKTLGDLVLHTKHDLIKIPTIGKKTLTELEDLVEAKGLDFGMDISKYKLENPSLKTPLNLAVEYVKQSQVADSKGLSAMLLGDVAELIKITTGKTIDCQDLEYKPKKISEGETLL